MPPWDKVKPELFRPAFDKASAELLAEIDTITANRDAPTFANTMVPLELAGASLNRVSRLFSVMTNNMNAPVYQAIDAEVSPKLSALYDSINFNAALFARVKAIHAARLTSGLTAEQIRLVEDNYDGFVRAGANLDDAAKAKVAGINQELSRLFIDFGNRVQADEDSWVVLADKDLSGLPPAVVVTAGHDPLVDEGDEYAARLKAAGVPVMHKRFDSLAHAFTAFTFISPGSRAACQETAEMVHDMFAKAARVAA